MHKRAFSQLLESSGLTGLILLTLMISVIGCGEKVNRSDSILQSNAVAEISSLQTLDKVVQQIENLNIPPGADQKVFSDLKAELERLLIAGGMDRFPAKAPGADPNNSVALNVDSTSLTWNEARWGDWNNDGAVSALDLTPLGTNFGKNANAESQDYYRYAEYIDGNKDGFVNAGDLTPIAFHFGESTGGYNIYEANDGSGTGSVKVAEVTRPQPPPDNQNPPTNTSFASLQYDTATAQINPPGWTPTVGKFYLVVPFDATPSKIESTGVMSSWVELPFPVNQQPVAILSTNPTSGYAPLQVNFDAGGSFDSDGTIILYEFDYETDETWDQTGTSSLASRTYTTDGIYRATVRVTDNNGATGSAFVDISVTTPANKGPVAVANASPVWGDPPMHVNFSASGSYDEDGTIVLYEWDFTDDGTFDWSNSVNGDTQYTFNNPGTYTARLRVTDNNGAPSSDTVFVNAFSGVWAHTWGWGYDDYVNGMALDGSGGIYLTGYTYSFGAGSYDVFLLKYDSSGNFIWAKSWGGPFTESSQAVDLDGSGNIYLAGTTRSFGAGGEDVSLLKFSSSGDLIWERTWGGSDYDTGLGIYVDEGENIYLAGTTRSFGAGDYDAFLLKFDSSGNIESQKTWGGTGKEDFTVVTKDQEGNIYLAGSTVDDPLILKYDNAGNLLWSRTYLGGYKERIWSIAIDENGDLILGGGSEKETGPREADTLLMKYDSSGNLIWARIWEGGRYDYCRGAVPTASGDIFAWGSTSSFALGGYEVLLLKYNSSGQLLSSRTWSTDGGDEELKAGTVDASGNIFLAGYAPNNGGTWKDVTGTDGFPIGTAVPYAGTESSPSGTIGSPTGTETSPPGVIDTGGGNADALLLKNLP